MTAADARIGADDTILPVTNYTIIESSTPTVATDTSGSIGGASVTLGTVPADWRLLHGKPIRLSSSAIGQTRLFVRDRVLTDRSTLNLTVTSVAEKLNIDATVPPVTGTLEDAVDAWFEVAGLESSEYEVDVTIADRSVVVPGWAGNMWSQMKLWCAIEGIEMVDAGDKLYVRALRTSEITLDTASNLTEQLTPTQLGRFIEVYNYNSEHKEDALVYPAGEWNEEGGYTAPNVWTPDVPVLTVSPGAPTVVEVPVNASLLSVEQPVCVRTVTRDYVDSSVYTVVMNNGVETIDPDVWTAKGGKITVEILEDTTTLRITVDAGNNESEGAPYRICMSAGSGADYSTLRIIGTGVFTSRRRHRFPTGHTDEHLQEIAQTIDTPFVSDMARMHDVAMQVNSSITNSFATVTATLAASVGGAGDIAGSRVRTATGIYRVRGATFSPGMVNANAEHDVLFDDFDKLWTSADDFDDFDAAWTDDFTFGDLAAQPLRR